MYVGLNAATVGPGSSYVWKAVSSNLGVASIRVKTTDPNFHLGTIYYVYTKAVSVSDAIISINLRQ